MAVRKTYSIRTRYNYDKPIVVEDVSTLRTNGLPLRWVGEHDNGTITLTFDCLVEVRRNDYNELEIHPRAK